MTNLYRNCICDLTLPTFSSQMLGLQLYTIMCRQKLIIAPYYNLVRKIHLLFDLNYCLFQEHVIISSVGFEALVLNNIHEPKCTENLFIALAYFPRTVIYQHSLNKKPSRKIIDSCSFIFMPKDCIFKEQIGSRKAAEQTAVIIGHETVSILGL